MSFVPKEVQQQHSVKLSGDRAIGSFKKLPLLTDLIYVQVLACQNKHPYFETSGAVDRCQNIANTFCALFTGRNRSNTSTNQKTVCSCWYVTIKARGTVHQTADFFIFCNFHQPPCTLPPSSTNLGRRASKKMFWRQFVERYSHFFQLSGQWRKRHNWG